MRMSPHHVIIMSLALPAPAAADELREKDFAYGLELELGGSDALQTVLLPVELYRGVVRADLGDVRVFNGQGQVVPHAIRSLARPVSDTEAAATVKLPFFPLRGSADLLDGDLSLRVQRSAAGTIIDIKSEGGSNEEATAPKIVAYLLDASAVEDEIRELRLRWTKAGKSFMARVAVAASDDLSTWVTVATGTSIAQLDYQGHSLERRIVRLSQRRAKYLRITWEDDDPPFALTEVTATPRPEVHEPERKSTYLESTADEKEPNLFHFDAGGPIPVDQISFNLPQRNTLAQAELQSASEPGGTWSTRYRGLVYRVEFDGNEISNEPIDIGRRTDRYWRLRVDPKGGGLGGGAPSMEIAWLPQQLLFVARGDAPFHLAHGSYAAQPSTFDAASLLALVPGQNLDGLAEQTVYVGARRILGGDAALQPPAPATPWMKWILWGLLVFGVLLLGWMTVRLVRQLNQSGGGDGGTSNAA